MEEQTPSSEETLAPVEGATPTVSSNPADEFELFFTPENITQIEDQTKRSFGSMMADYSMTTVVVFLKKGMRNLNGRDIYKVLEEYADKGGELLDLYVKIADALGKRGFLSKKDVENAKEIARQQSM